MIDKFIIYKVTCRTSGKAYIGITTIGIARRWSTHKRDARVYKRPGLGRAIRRYGEADFDVSHLASAINQKDLLMVERLLIFQEQTLSPGGYNLTGGGEAGAFDLPDAVRQKMSDAQKGKKASLESRARRSASLLGRPGKKPSAETLIRMSLARTGKKATPEARAKNSLSHLGKIRSATHCANIAKAKQGHVVSEETRARIAQTLTGRVGAKRSAETKQKMSIAQTGRTVSEDTRRKIALSLTGITVPDERRIRISQSLTGRKVSAETRLKLKLAWQRRRASLAASTQGTLVL